MFLCCFMISNWFKMCFKKIRNASKNLLTCAWLAIRKNLSYILDQSVVRQQAINISYICSLPVTQSWQLHAILVLAGLGSSCVNHYFIYTSLAYEASSFWSQVSGFWQSRPSSQHIQQTARLVNFYPKHSPRFPSYLRTQDSESQMVNDFNSSDGLATEGLSWYLV